MTDRPAIVGRYTWAGGHDPALTVWLGDSPHHWDGDQLVLHDDGREIRPEPGYLIVLWSDGMANAASPRVAERVYQSDGSLYDRLTQAEAAGKEATP